jgi:hypothetical protein
MILRTNTTYRSPSESSKMTALSIKRKMLPQTFESISTILAVRFATCGSFWWNEDLFLLMQELTSVSPASSTILFEDTSIMQKLLLPSEIDFTSTLSRQRERTAPLSHDAPVIPKPYSPKTARKGLRTLWRGAAKCCTARPLRSTSAACRSRCPCTKRPSTR